MAPPPPQPPPNTPFSAAPDVPISNASPFEGLLALGPVSETNNTAQLAERWQCGSTLLSADTFHGLRIAIEDADCSNDTLTVGVYVCGTVVVDQSTYNAVSSGEGSLRSRKNVHADWSASSTIPTKSSV